MFKWTCDFFQGNILEDETAIEVLSSSKVLSEEISVKQEIASKTEQEIDDVRNGYKPVSGKEIFVYLLCSPAIKARPNGSSRHQRNHSCYS